MLISIILVLVEELQEVYDQAKAKHKEETRKLYNVSLVDDISYPLLKGLADFSIEDKFRGDYNGR